jgi:hypothetical protein
MAGGANIGRIAQEWDFVRSFPDVSKGSWLVSTNGGDGPLWSPAGHELFFRGGDGVMAVISKDRAEFQHRGNTPDPFSKNLGSDIYGGKHSVGHQPPTERCLQWFKESEAPAAAGPRFKINIVLNWLEELKQRVPPK